MEIRRITDQGGPLEEFYAELAALGRENYYSAVGTRMLELVARLRETDGPAVWAVTSHAMLNLIPGDDYRLPVLVSVGWSGDLFHIEYRMPPEEAPWPDAYVKGRASDAIGAVEMIILGLNQALRASDLGGGPA